MKAMLQCIGATIQEVVEVNGCALSEPELWSTLRSVSKWLLRNNVSAELKRKNFIITPQKVILLPFGQVAINYDGNEDSNNVFSSNQLLNFANGKLHDNSLMVYSLGLTLLWCAEYNLPGNSPLSISNELLELVSSMCSLEETSFEQVHAVCCQREDV
uniref:KIND domain-containing protein n=1 Tax=Ciona savignyi TaxID=51511 RepID=H2YEK6_CIOSA